MNIVGLLCLSYDIIMLPIQVFEIDENDFLLALDWVCLLFTTGDIPIDFTTACSSNTH